MNTKKLIPLFLYLSFILLSFSCGGNKENKEDNSADILFEKSVSLIKDFQTKIKNSPDSLTVDSLSELFEKQLTDLNFSVPPQTDMKLSEQENDSLATLLFQLEDLKKEKLKSLSKHPVSEKDSIETVTP